MGINKITKRILHSPDVVHHSAKLVPLHGVVPVCVYLSNHLGKGVSGDPLTKVVKDRLELLGINVAVAVHIKGLKCTALDGGGKEWGGQNRERFKKTAGLLSVNRKDCGGLKRGKSAYNCYAYHFVNFIGSKLSFVFAWDLVTFKSRHDS